MRVVVDTNAFYSDLMMTGALRVLLDGSRNGDFTLVVPEVVLQEVLKRFRLRYVDETRRLTTSLRSLTEMGVEGMQDPEIPTVEEALIQYEAHLRGRLHDANALVPPVPTVPNDEMLDRAIQRKKPFKENGSGYQDALIWINVLEETDAGEVVFISKNTSDFGEADANQWRLAEDLRADLVERDVDPSTVKLYREVRDFIGTDLGAEEQDLVPLREALVEDEARRRVLERAIVDDLERHPQDLANDLLRSGEVEIARVVSSSVDTLDVIDAYEFVDDDDLYVLLRARVTAEVEFDLDRGEAERLARDERALVAVWGDGLVTGKKTADLEVEAEVMLDQAGDPEALDVVSAKVIEEQRRTR